MGCGYPYGLPVYGAIQYQGQGQQHQQRQPPWSEHRQQFQNNGYDQYYTTGRDPHGSPWPQNERSTWRQENHTAPPASIPAAPSARANKKVDMENLTPFQKQVI